MCLAMVTNDSGPERKERIERRASRDAMRLLTGGLTHEGDTFLIAAGAVILLSVLYPHVGGWAFLAFPVVFVAAVLVRGLLGRDG